MYITDEEMFNIPATEQNDGNLLTANPLVSVILLAYNHEKFISEAIESILNQEADFSYEILIGEDKSTDNTFQICSEYQKKYPDKIRLITSVINVGMHKNFSRLWCRCRGEFIAFCEGDDYWCDDQKLGKQVNFLSQNPVSSMCGAYTDRIQLRPEGNWIVSGRQGPVKIREEYTVYDLIPAYNFHTSSILIRKSFVQFPVWLWNVYCVDRPLYLLCAEKGPVGFIPECMSVYRLHEGGIWSGSLEAEKAKKSIQLFEYLDKYFEYEFHNLIKKTIGKIVWAYAMESLFANDYKAGRQLFKISLGYALPSLPVEPVAFFKAFIRLFFPYIYNLLKS